jgi:hypothetical protein
MLRQPTSMDWSLVEEAEWERLRPVETGSAERTAHANPHANPDGWILAHAAHGVTLLLAALVLTGATFAHAPPSSSWAYETILPTLQLEVEAWAAHDRDLLDRTIDGNVSPRFQDEWRVGWETDDGRPPVYRVHVLDVAPEGELIRVQLRVDQSDPRWWLSNPHRETRFYRQTAAGWLRTVPPTQFWGKQRVIETSNMRFEFYDYDFDTVIDVVDNVELAYVRAYAWLGVPLPPTTDKVTVAIMPDLVRGWGAFGNRLLLTSSTVTDVPATLSDADYLTQQIVARMASRTLNRLFESYERTNTYQWRTMIWALNGWWRSELTGQRSPWHQQAEARFRRYLPTAYPLRLRDISANYPSWRVDQEMMMVEYMRAESLVAYLMQRYGRERLRDLVEGFNDYGSWATILSTLYETTPAAFEADWNRYLAHRYGIALIRP